jgi:tocopherol cyclase
MEVEAHADGVAPHLLPVPVPHERRRLDDWAPQHLTGTMRLSVRRRGRTLYEGTSELAGLERGRGHLG